MSLERKRHPGRRKRHRFQTRKQSNTDIVRKAKAKNPNKNHQKKEKQQKEKPEPNQKGRRRMTQKGGLFKGKQKKKTIPPNRHGKIPHVRKGKRFVKPSQVTKEMDADKELSKFINQCNEVKAATIANKEGGQLSIVKPPPEPAGASKK